MRAAVHASKMTASPQPWYLSADRAASARASVVRAFQSGSASARGSSSSSSASLHSHWQPVTRAGLRSIIPSRSAYSITRTSTARLFLTVDRLHSSVIHACTARSTAPFAWPNLNRDGHCLANWPSP